MELVGKVVKKEIEGIGFVSGTVRSSNSSGFHEIVYENGAVESLGFDEVAAMVNGERKPEVGVKPRVGRRTKNRNRNRSWVGEIKGESSGGGNEVSVMRNVDLNDRVEENLGVSDGFVVSLRGNVDLNCGPVETLMDLNRTVTETGFDLTTGLDWNEGLVTVNVDYEEHHRNGKKRGFIDLNVDASCELDSAEVCDLSVEKREGGIDLNLDVSAEDSKEDGVMEMNGNSVVQEINMQEENGVQDEVQTGDSDFKDVPVAEVADAAQLLEGLRKKNLPADNGPVDETPSERKVVDEDTSVKRKRRKGSTTPKVVSEPRLRRSARRKLAPSPVSSTVTACLVEEVSPSPSINSPTEEKTCIAGDKAENISLLPPKPQLPPSSNILNLEGLPVLDVFAAYSCLRSFSTLLFLSPFELKDFVDALRCMSPSPLFDSIHVTVLQILRRHLKQLAAEGDLSASVCLRSLDWDTLDVVTYPLFVAEYLLFSGSKDNQGMDLTRLNFFRNEYFRQPMNLKVEILSRLCHDMIDAEVVRSELNKRSFAAESEMELDKKTNTEMRRRKRTTMDMAAGSSDEVIDRSFDRNSDYCCFCKMDGNLLCCDGCPAAYHSKCVGVASHLLPEGDWYCPECAFDRQVPGLKPEKQIRGAEFLESDPHGRKYYSSCGYLFVLDTDISGSLNYYHVNDVNLVLEQLRPCSRFYCGVITAIKKLLDIHVGLKRTVSGTNSQMSVCLDKEAKGTPSADGFNTPLPAPEKLSTSGVEKKLDETSSNGGSHSHCRRTRRKVSNSATGTDILNISSARSASQNGFDVQSLHELAASRILDVMKEPDLNIQLSSHNLARISTRKGTSLNVQSEIGYRNRYVFAQMTSSISEEMMRKSPIHTIDMRSDEEIASTQVKTILMKTTRFQWRNIQSLYLDAWKEKCGWCHSCKSSSEDGSEANCLLNMSLGALRGLSESEVTYSQSNNKQSHLLVIICQILSMESRLQGLLGGPWSNPQHSRIWRERILNASSISGLRHLLVQLETNLHHRVLSLEWQNYVDSAVVMGSAIHMVIASTRSWSKSAIGKRRGTLLESGVNPTAKKNVGLTMCWWRGGRLSRRLFNWKVLPRSLISKAARQGGSVNIPGILYPENLESAKRSRRVTWEAAVESSMTSEQLGLQVRTLQSYILWDDIENSHPLPATDKESKKSARLFKKAILRRKCTEEETVKYLLDFGKRRNFPDVVLKNGVIVEESSSGRKRFWLNESYVPLHLLKGFEEKKAVRKASKPGVSSRLSKIDKVRKRSSQKNGFAYLFERAERSESSLCEQCKKDVPLSEAASCHICKGLFHKKHIRKAEKEGLYICVPCRTEVTAKEQPIKRKRGRPPGTFRKKIGGQTQKYKKVTPARKSARLTNTKTSLAAKISVRLKNHKKVVANKPLRRSGRQPKHVIRLQDESKVPEGSKKRKLETKRGRGRPKKIKQEKQEISIRKERTEKCFSYWLNGLLLSRKPGDERVSKFRKDGCYIPLENSGLEHDQPKCHLCGTSESDSGTTFIVCDKCGEFYHGDAYGLNEKNLSMVIGFRCHHCREQSSPICPHTRCTTTPAAP